MAITDTTERRNWREFANALNRLAGLNHA